MRAIVLFGILFAAVLGELTMDSLQAQINALTARIDDFQNAGILLYNDREDCPEGFHPWESANNRLLLVDGSRRGEISQHSFEDRKKIMASCVDTIGVAESGFQRVCSHSLTGSELDVKWDEQLPYFKVLACKRNNGPAPVLP